MVRDPITDDDTRLSFTENYADKLTQKSIKS